MRKGLQGLSRRCGFEVTTADVAALKPQERHIVRLLYGLEYYHHSLNQCGEIFGLTRERIRQLEEVSLRKIVRRAKKGRFRNLKDWIGLEAIETVWPRTIKPEGRPD